MTPGWAYLTGGGRLAGKQFIAATTAGGTENSYRAGGNNWYTISELLRPLQSTIDRCKGICLPPFVTYEANNLPESQFEEARRYAAHIMSAAEILMR